MLLACAITSFVFTDRCECCNGPGYATPLDAMKLAPREKLVYIPCIQVEKGRKDYLATVCIDPGSKDFCKVSLMSDAAGKIEPCNGLYKPDS